MFQLIIILHGSQTNFAMVYKTRNAAHQAQQEIRIAQAAIPPHPLSETPRPTLTVTDDYGHIAEFIPHNIQAHLLTDLEQEHAANVERQLLQQRAAKRLQDRVAVDPVINMKAALHGPGIN